ncbi:hypothetical protein QJQ45_027331 [Haematococcus lacustris]|nr:hypothetical protein QJQ45_027331 [Haematococcus lacustris]
MTAASFAVQASKAGRPTPPSSMTSVADDILYSCSNGGQDAGSIGHPSPGSPSSLKSDTHRPRSSGHVNKIREMKRLASPAASPNDPLPDPAPSLPALSNQPHPMSAGMAALGPLNSRLGEQTAPSMLRDLGSVFEEESEVTVATDDEESLLEGEGLDKSRQASAILQPAADQPRMMDELSILMANGPLAKIRVKMAAADGLAKAKDVWGVVRVRQEILGLAKVYMMLNMDGPTLPLPLPLPAAHFKLAQAYAELGCSAQVIDHSQKALSSLPVQGEYVETAEKMKKDIHLLMGDTLLQQERPQPQVQAREAGLPSAAAATTTTAAATTNAAGMKCAASVAAVWDAAEAAVPPVLQIALQHFLVAAGAASLRDVQQLDILVLACQCCAMMGEVKLDQARSTLGVRQKLQAAVEQLEVKVVELTDKVERVKAAAKEGQDKDKDKMSLQQQLSELKAMLKTSQMQLNDLGRELEEETQYQAKLLQEAHTQLDMAFDAFWDGVVAEEGRLENMMGRDAARKVPLLAVLHRQASELLLKLGAVVGLQGDLNRQLNLLREVVTMHETYGTLTLPLMARVYRERGAVLLQLKSYDDALAAYDSLHKLQTKQYQEDPHLMALAQGECMKLEGDVYVAKRMFGRAAEQFEAARELFTARLGANDNTVVELENRITQLKRYTSAQEAVASLSNEGAKKKPPMATAKIDGETTSSVFIKSRLTPPHPYGASKMTTQAFT